MSRPAVNINFHHLADLVGEEVDSALPLLAKRHGFSGQLLEAAGAIRSVTLDRDHFVAVGNPTGALLQSFLAQKALQGRDSYLDSNGVLQLDGLS